MSTHSWTVGQRDCDPCAGGIILCCHLRSVDMPETTVCPLRLQVPLVPWKVLHDKMDAATIQKKKEKYLVSKQQKEKNKHFSFVRSMIVS